MNQEIIYVRLDKWLWAARFFRTRQLAKQAIDGGKVTLNGNKGKCSSKVMLGAQLVIRKEQELFEVEVIGLSETRGSASLAQALYQETATSIQRRQENKQTRKMATPIRPNKRPDKKSRRELIQFKYRDNET